MARKMVHVGLEYHLPHAGILRPSLRDEDLEKIIELTKKIKDAKKNIGEKYPDVRLVIGTCSDSASYYIYLNGKREEVSQATATLINSAGVPDFTLGGYDIIDKILGQYGKKTKRSFLGLFAGKQVAAI